MTDRVENLLKLANGQEQVELKILHNAVITNAKSYQSDPSSANLKDWNNAKQGLADLIDRLDSKYDAAQSVVATPESFAELADVLGYLTSTGWSISRSGLFNHQKDGKIKRDKKTKRFLLDKVEKYAKRFLKRADTGVNPFDEQEQLQERKLKSEVRLKDAQAEKAELELKIAMGQFIDREDMERELVARALILDSSLRHLLKTSTPEWIDLVAGKQQKANELMEAMSGSLDQVMNSFASTDDFLVELTGDQL